MFCSDVKKAIMKTLPFDYGLYPPPDVGNEGVQIKFVKDRADVLLKTSAYLHGEPDALVCFFLLTLDTTQLMLREKQAISPTPPLKMLVSPYTIATPLANPSASLSNFRPIFHTKL